MQEQFNAAALANLTKAELLTLKANLRAQFNTAVSDTERENCRSQISVIDNALALK